MKCVIYSFAFSLCVGTLVHGKDQREERSSFPIPLAKLSVVFDRAQTLNEVRVRLPGNRNEWILTPRDDAEIRKSDHGEERHLYRESYGSPQLISDFEAGVLDNVIKSLTKTLSILERDLQRKNWDRCRYLDAYLPRFLRAYSYLHAACLGQSQPHPDMSIQESEYEVSLNSPKSDARVAFWIDRIEHRVQLRIATLELIHQARMWQKQDIGKSRRDESILHSEKFERAFALFVKLYFNKTSGR